VEITRENLLILYTVVVTPIVISFFFIRKGSKPPVTLKMREDTFPQPAPERKALPRSTRATAGRSDAGRAYAQGETIQNPSETSLNVMFNWNGHSWDAYEVLGVPAGSSREAVTASYQAMKLQADGESLPFLQAAFEAITSTRSH
jgi:hypothetical protein